MGKHKCSVKTGPHEGAMFKKKGTGTLPGFVPLELCYRHLESYKLMFEYNPEDWEQTT